MNTTIVRIGLPITNGRQDWQLIPDMPVHTSILNLLYTYLYVKDRVFTYT